MPNPNSRTGQETFLSTEVNAAVYEKILRQNNFADRTIGEVLTAIAVIPDHNVKKGIKFEKLTQWALPLAKSAEIKSVHKPRGRDIGMDLIATGEDDKKVAIQCKFYTAQNIHRTELLKFRDAAEAKNIDAKWLVCGGRGIGDEAKKFTERHNIRIVDLRQYRDTVLTTRPRQTRAPLPLQQEAIDAVVQGIKGAKPGKHGDRRGKLIMACGTGKTFTSLRIAEQLAPGRGANILFIAPSIALVAQARKEYLDHSARKLRTLIICSDQTAGHDEDIQPNEITGRVTTSPKEIAAALSEPIAGDAARATFCTYQSLDKLLEAQTKHRAPKFDLAIIDEAHRTTGLLKEGDEGQFLLIHDAGKIQADMRLYMTATQRIYKDSAAVRKAKKDPGIAVVDMNDTARYGNLFYHLTFKQAVNAGILCDYRVIALGVTETIIGPRLTDNLLALNDEVADATARKSRKGRAADAQSVLALGAISLAINGFIKGGNHPDSIARTIAYANNIVRSKWLKRALQEPQMKRWVTLAGRRDSESARALTIDAKHLDGTSSAVARHTALNWLGDGSASSPRLITNAQLFTEGVDVPALNAIAFLDPRKSKIDTVQAVGRVMRKDRGNSDKVHGYIIVPVIVPPGSNLLETLKTDKARFQSLGNVMRALRSHDERFDTDLHLLLGEVDGEGGGSDNGRDPIPEGDIQIQQTLLDDETKRAIFAQLTKDTGIGNAGKNTADDITIAINRAAALLQAAGASHLIAETIGTPTDNAEESCKTAALLIANACIMHKRLDETGNLGDLAKIETAHNAGNPPDALYRAWVTILAKDYSPIFQDAAALARKMSKYSGMHDAVRVLTECAMSNATTLNELGFDHAGPLYHRVLGTAQSDGAFYTKNLSAYLLAGLAFGEDFVDWSDAAKVENLKIIDPACGTGTLLMAALNIIKKRAAKAQNLSAEQTNRLHKKLVENAIYGFDINKYSVQLAACNLTIGAPDTDYARINLHTLQHGPVKGKDGDSWHGVAHGALEKLLDEKKMVQMTLEPPPPLYGDNVMRKGTAKVDVPEEFDAVIYNPPFTDTSKQGRKYTDRVTRAMQQRLQLIKNDLEKRDPAAAKSISKMSIQPFFTPLAKGFLPKDNAKLAKIIPATVCTAENARAQRQYLANNFHIEAVVTSHDPKHINFSENTAVHECLLIGKRGAGNGKPTRFIQLAEYPSDVKAADQLIAAIENDGDANMTAVPPPPPPPKIGYSETRWPAERVRAGDWTPVQWFNPDLAHAADEINRLPNMIAAAHICPVNYMGQSFRSTFSYQTNGGGKGNSFCTIAEDIMQTMFAKPETEATPKSGKERHAKTAWKKATRFLIPARFSTTSSRLLAIYSEKPAIGSAYYAMAAQTPEQEKAFAAFMNSSFGIIQMLNRRTKKLTYPAYEVGHLKTLMLPDPSTVDLAPLLEAFESVKDTPLQRLSKCFDDPARKTLDHAAAKALGVDPAITDQWREWLSQEPTITNKPRQP